MGGTSSGQRDSKSGGEHRGKYPFGIRLLAD